MSDSSSSAPSSFQKYRGGGGASGFPPLPPPQQPLRRLVQYSFDAEGGGGETGPWARLVSPTTAVSSSLNRDDGSLAVQLETPSTPGSRPLNRSATTTPKINFARPNLLELGGGVDGGVYAPTVSEVVAKLPALTLSAASTGVRTGTPSGLLPSSVVSVIGGPPSSAARRSSDGAAAVTSPPSGPQRYHGRVSSMSMQDDEESNSRGWSAGDPTVAPTETSPEVRCRNASAFLERSGSMEPTPTMAVFPSVPIADLHSVQRSQLERATSEGALEVGARQRSYLSGEESSCSVSLFYRENNMQQALHPRVAESSRAVTLFVSCDPSSFLVARFFCARMTHHMAWAGDSTRLFMLGVGEEDLHEFGCKEWAESLEQLAACATEYLGTAQVLGLAATPTAIVMGDFESEEALRSAEKAVIEAWVNLPGVNTSQQSIAFRYIRFAENWRTEAEMLAGASRVDIRSHIEVNLCLESLRTSKSKTGVVCSMVASYLVQVLSLLCFIHKHEPRDRSAAATKTMQCLPPLFFTRHGQSEYNIEDRLGGNPSLTNEGLQDAIAIGKFFEVEVAENPCLFAMRNQLWGDTIPRDQQTKSENGSVPRSAHRRFFEVWCSQLKRTVQTAAPAASVLTDGVVRKWSYLNEIHAGVCEDMTNSEVKGHFPALHDFRKKNKVAFRYPAGESYLDLMIRLKPVLLELEATPKCILVVAHQAVLRTILSYFGGPPVEEAVQTECPHRTVWCCSFDRSGCPRLATISLPHVTSDSATDPQGGTHAPVVQWEGW